MARTPRARRAVGDPIGRRLGWFEQHQSTAVDSLLRLWSDPLGSVLAALVTGIALALPLTLFLLLQNVRDLGPGLDEAGTVSLYLRADLDEAGQRAVADLLGARDDVAGVVLVTPEQALAQFEAVSGFTDVLASLDHNPLPPVAVITPVALDAATLERLQRELPAIEGVDEVEFDLAWLERLHALVGLAQRLATLLGVMLALGVLLVIINTIRLSIENRRTEIVVVKLVGGTDAYVARPFLYSGLWYGITGGLVALALSALAMSLLASPYGRLLGSYGGGTALRGLDLTGGFLLLAGTAALGWLGALVSVLRHLRAIEPR